MWSTLRLVDEFMLAGQPSHLSSASAILKHWCVWSFSHIQSGLPLPRGLFLTQGLNLHLLSLLHHRQILHC